MQINRIKSNQVRLTILLLILTISQLLVNSLSLVYLDLLGVFLIVLLVNQLCFYRHLFLIAFLADMIGHWYLGTHLFALITVSFLVDRYINFYKISNIFQKTVVIILFYSLFNSIIAIIGLLTHNMRVDIFSFIVEVLILCPITFFITSKVMRLSYVDSIFND